jgi:hypothetical protein
LGSAVGVVSCIVSSCYLATTSKQTEDFICAVVVVICRVCDSVKLLHLFVVMSYKFSINPIINPNPMSSYLYMTIYYRIRLVHAQIKKNGWRCGCWRLKTELIPANLIPWLLPPLPASQFPGVLTEMCIFYTNIVYNLSGNYNFQHI